MFSELSDGDKYSSARHDLSRRFQKHVETESERKCTKAGGPKQKDISDAYVSFTQSSRQSVCAMRSGQSSSTIRKVVPRLIYEANQC